jgi:hypothetical protein
MERWKNIDYRMAIEIMHSIDMIESSTGLAQTKQCLAEHASQ